VEAGVQDELARGARISAEVLVPLVIDLVQPRAVVDVGCGRGVWLEVFRAHGVEDLFGVDVERDDLQIDLRRFMAADLTEPLEVGRGFDLAVSLEVAEHLPPEAAETLVASLATLAPVVLFSAAIPRQMGEGRFHLNEQWPAYWAEHFERHGLHCIDAVRPKVWDRDEVRVWYVQNTLLYATDEALAANPTLRAEHERRGGRPMAIVHPRMWERQRLREQVATLQRENRRLKAELGR
jgi:SAM-dependent methyltransferase